MPTDPPHKVYNVLFLCTGNSCRSILAEAIMNRRGAGRFRAFSAGSMPTGQVNPHALDLLKRQRHDTHGMRSKSWSEFSRQTNPDAPELDFVFTVCDDAAGEVCPIWPGQPMTAHWGMPDPARATGSEAEIGVAFADTYRMLDNRIALFTSLPLAALDRMALQKRLDEIGQSAPATAQDAS
jgi:protein-tyrosine-phosphatase